MVYTTSSSEETQKLGQTLAQNYQEGAILALFGPLGSGKTTFVQGLAQGLAITDRLISPTFILMRQYSIPGNIKGQLFHLDLYRLNNITQIKELGLEEIFSNPNNLVIIEWAEKLEDLQPNNITEIHFKNTGKNSRKIRLIKPRVIKLPL